MPLGDRQTIRRLAAALLALSVCGCDAQATPDYLGDAALSLRGSIVIDSTRERGELIPALAFANDRSGMLHIMEVQVEGEFPSNFQLTVHGPPPPASIVDDGELPRHAIAYLTAVTLEHPEVIPLRASSAGWGVCQADAEGADVCEQENEWCTAAGSCYRELIRCPAIDSPRTDCEVLESEGDPSLRADPWEHFAGLSETHTILFLEAAVPADHPAAQELGVPGLRPGYHLLRALTGADRVGFEQCTDQARARAVRAYNARHGTDFEPPLFVAAVACGSTPAPVSQSGQGGTATPAPGDDLGEGGQPDASVPAEPAEAQAEIPDCHDPGVDVDWAELDELDRMARLDLDCGRFTRPNLIEDPASEHISVRISADVRPAW